MSVRAASIVAPQLLRFEVNQMQAACIGEQLARRLTPRQMRLFARALGAVRQGYADPPRFTYPDVMWVANAMGDAAVPRALRQADAACGVTPGVRLCARDGRAAAARRAAARRSGAAAPRARPTGSISAPRPSGQTIAIDASTLVRERRPAHRLVPADRSGQRPARATMPICSGSIARRRTINAKARERRERRRARSPSMSIIPTIRCRWKAGR